MRIQTRARVGIVSSIIVSAVIIVFAIFILRSIRTDLARSQTGYEIIEMTSSLASLIDSFKDDPTPRVVQQLNSVATSLSEHLRQIPATSGEEKDILEQMLASAEDINSLLKLALTPGIVREGTDIERRNIIASRLWIKMRFLGDDARRFMESSQDRIGQAYARGFMAIVGLMGLLILASGVIFFFTSTRMSRGIVLLAQGAKQIGSGAVAHRIFIGGNDELTYLATTFNAMAGSLEAATRRQQQAQDSLKAAKEEADIANRAKSEFLANMSHEIRTPMNGILGMTELAIMSTKNPKVRQYLDLVKQSGQALLEIINDILDMSKVEAGRIELEHKEFSLREVVDATIGPLRMGAEAKGIALFYGLDQEVPDRLLGDQGRLRQVLTNVVGNAVKYTERGSVAISVGLDDKPSSPEEACLAFTVRDTGVGIPKDKLPTIFEAFSQVGSSAHVKFGGTGLGLYITKRLVEMMGGTIWAESEVGKGSTFHFTLSLGLAAGAEPPLREAPPQAAGPVHTLGILLVEDNLVNRLLAVELLQRRGHEVQTAENGQEALAKLRGKRFDLVLMDVRMPVMDGLEATRRIRQGEGGAPDVPIVALTAHALKGDRERFLAVGMSDYLPKPLDLEELDRVLARVMT